MMGMELLSVWYDRWGLGRPTGIGIPEASGRPPRATFDGPLAERQAKLWFSGHRAGPGGGYADPDGQRRRDDSRATALWMRPPSAERCGRQRPGHPPRAAEDGQQHRRFPTAGPRTPDKVDLNLSPAGLAAARDGMQPRHQQQGRHWTRAFSPKAPEELNGIAFCAKTGTAQAPHFMMKFMDEHGKPVARRAGAKPVLYGP